MRICPKNAAEFGEKISPDQAAEWCRARYEKAACLGCDYLRKIGAMEIKAEVKSESVNPVQGRLF